VPRVDSIGELWDDRSDLTNNVYADLEALPKRIAIMRLPSFLKSDGARKCAHKLWTRSAISSQTLSQQD